MKTHRRVCISSLSRSLCLCLLLTESMTLTQNTKMTFHHSSVPVRSISPGCTRENHVHRAKTRCPSPSGDYNFLLPLHKAFHALVMVDGLTERDTWRTHDAACGAQGRHSLYVTFITAGFAKCGARLRRRRSTTLRRSLYCFFRHLNSVPSPFSTSCERKTKTGWETHTTDSPDARRQTLRRLE